MNSNNNIDLMKMTSAERIKYRRDNWKKPFGKSDNYFSSISEKEVFMEFVGEPLLSNETVNLINKLNNSNNETDDLSGWDFMIEEFNEIARKKNKENKNKENKNKENKNRKKFDWKPIHDLFDTIYTVCHRKKDMDGLFDINYSWMDEKKYSDEYFKLLNREESIIKYIKDNIKRANIIDTSLNLVFNDESKNKKSGEYKPKFLDGVENKLDKRNLIVFNLPQNINDSSMIRFFSRFGDIRKVHIMKDNRTNKPRGFGFINTYDVRTAEKIIKECDGKPMGHNILKVHVSDKNKKR